MEVEVFMLLNPENLVSLHADFNMDLVHSVPILC